MESDKHYPHVHVQLCPVELERMMSCTRSIYMQTIFELCELDRWNRIIGYNSQLLSLWDKNFGHSSHPSQVPRRQFPMVCLAETILFVTLRSRKNKSVIRCTSFQADLKNGASESKFPGGLFAFDDPSKK